MKRTMSIAALVGAVAIAGTIAGCGSSGSSGGDTKKSDFKAGLVTDIGGVNDRSFNFLAKKGLDEAGAKAGFTPEIRESKSETDYVPNITRLANSGSNLVVTVGFLMGAATGEMAKQFPKTNFAIVDFSVTDKAIASAPNVRGLLFKEQEAGYLAGYLAGLVEESTIKGVNPKKVVGVVGGMKIPPVDRYIAGFQAGVKATSPQTKVLVAYSQDFVAQNKCKDQTLAQIEQGSDIEFQVAGQCGLGTLSAAKDKGIWGIGVDADQAYLGAHILTSAMKRVDVAVAKAASDAQAGTFTGGSDEVFDLKAGGVGLGAISADVPQDIQDKVKQAQQDIIDGKVTVPENVQ